MMSEICLLVFNVGYQWSKSACHIIGTRCRQDTEGTVSSGHYNIVQFITVMIMIEKCLLFFKIRGHIAMSYCNIVGKR